MDVVAVAAAVPDLTPIPEEVAAELKRLTMKEDLDIDQTFLALAAALAQVPSI